MTVFIKWICLNIFSATYQHHVSLQHKLICNAPTYPFEPAYCIYFISYFSSRFTLKMWCFFFFLNSRLMKKCWSTFLQKNLFNIIVWFPLEILKWSVKKINCFLESLWPISAIKRCFQWGILSATIYSSSIWSCPTYWQYCLPSYSMKYDKKVCEVYHLKVLLEVSLTTGEALSSKEYVTHLNLSNCISIGPGPAKWRADIPHAK